MTRIEVSGRINAQGLLEVKLPPGLPPCEAVVTIDLVEAPLTPEEMSHLMQTEPLTGSEIVESGLTGGWSDQAIPDGQAWVDAERQRRRTHKARA